MSSVSLTFKGSLISVDYCQEVCHASFLLLIGVIAEWDCWLHPFFGSLSGKFGALQSCSQGAEIITDQVLQVLCLKCLLRTGEMVFLREDSSVGYLIPSPQP